MLVSGGASSTLPIRVAPLPGEWSVSWLRRLALRYDIPPNLFFQQLGYRRNIHTLAAIVTRLKNNAHGLADHLLLTEDERLALTRQHPLDQATRYYARKYQRFIDIGRRPRFCPQCLAEEEPYWRDDWVQPMALCCPTHRRTLATACPGCGQTVLHQSAWAAAPIPLWQCTERIPRPPGSTAHVRPLCGHDLRTAPTTPVSQDVIDARAYLLELADTTGPSTRSVAGFDATRAQCFAAFVEIIDNAVPSGTDVLDPATPPEEIIDLLPLAAEVLRTRDAHEASAIARARGILAPYDDTSPIFSGAQIRNRCHSPVLVTIQLTGWADQLSKTDQLQFRTGHLIPRYPTKLTKGLTVEDVLPELSMTHLQELPYSSIPSALWPDALPERLRYLTLDEFHHHTLTMCLAKIGSTRTWGEIASSLSLPHTLSTSMSGLWRTVDGNGDWPLLRASLDDLATRLLETPPPIDYSRRRRLAPTVRDAVPPENLAAFLGGRGSPTCDPTPLVTLLRLDEPPTWSPFP